MYEPKHRGEYKEEAKMCIICNKRVATELTNSSGKDAMLCKFCYYSL